MSSTSKKHKAFVSESMKNKLVEDLPGIGQTNITALVGNGYSQADKVLGQFLVLEKNEVAFKKWLQETGGANPKSQRDCFNCLKEWCDKFL